MKKFKVKNINYANIHAFDFECLTEEKTRVWMFSMTPLLIPTLENTVTCKNIEGAIDHIFSKKHKRTKQYFYAHNLSYDISFILPHLFKFHGEDVVIKNAVVMPLTKKVYQVQINFRGCKIIFRDSYVLFTQPLANVMKGYTKFEKGETPLFAEMNESAMYTPENFLYSRIDSCALAVSLSERLKYGNFALTTASGAVNEFRLDLIKNKIMSNKEYDEVYFKPLSANHDFLIRKSYRGGFTFLNPSYAKKTIYNINKIDVNSMYPAIMYNELLPYGEPKIVLKGKVKTDKVYPLCLQRIRVKSAYLKLNKIPFITYNNSFSGAAIYESEIEEDRSENERTFLLTNLELQLFIESYDYEGIEYLGGFLFKASNRLFKSYINKFMAMKNSSEPAVKSVGKLFLNSLYGKFAEAPEKIGVNITFSDSEGVKYENGEIKVQHKGYLPVAVFITSYARVKLINSILKIGVKNFVYCDTDSIHFTGVDNVSDLLEISDSVLGAWKVEPSFKRAYYIRAKRYGGEVLENGKTALKLVCAGINNRALSEQITRLDDFRTSEVDVYGNLIREGASVKTFEMKNGPYGMYSRPKTIRI